MVLSPQDCEYLAHHCACCGKACAELEKNAILNLDELHLSREIFPFNYLTVNSVKVLNALTGVLMPSLRMNSKFNQIDKGQFDQQFWEGEELDVFSFCQQCRNIISVFFLCSEHMKSLASTANRSYVFEKLERYFTEPDGNSRVKNSEETVLCEICMDILPSHDAFIKHFSDFHDISRFNMRRKMKTLIGSTSFNDNSDVIVQQEELVNQVSSSLSIVPPTNVIVLEDDTTLYNKKLENDKANSVIHWGEHHARLNLVSELTTYLSSNADSLTLKCSLCDFSFVWRDGYEHLLRRHKEKVKLKYKCSWCYRKFLTQIGLDNHKSHHTKEKPFFCIHCGVSFLNLNELQQHNVTYHPTHRPIICSICNMWFHSTQLLSDHILTVHKYTDLKFFCLYVDCEQGLCSFDEIEIHIAEKHDNIVPSSCPECKLQFPDRLSAFLHQAICPANQEMLPKLTNPPTEEKPLNGFLKNNNSKRKPIKKRSEKRKTPKAKKPPKISNKPKVSEKTETVSTDTMGTTLTERNNKKAKSKAKELLEKFSSPAGFPASTPEQQDEKQMDSCQGGGKPGEEFLLCNICNAICSKSYMFRHILNQHQEKCNLDYICCVCGKGFVTDVRLTNHLKGHTSRKFECKDCRKVFAREKSLKSHVRIVHENRRFICNKCGKALRSKASMRDHEKIMHEGASRVSLRKIVHKCSFPGCGRAFAFPSARMEHEDIHTGTYRYSCKTCGKRFRQSSGYNGHLRLKTCTKKKKKNTEN